MRESLWSFPLGERENLGFISSCSLCLAARGEIKTAKENKIRHRQQIGGCGAERDGNLMEEGGKMKGKGVLGEGIHSSSQILSANPGFLFQAGDLSPRTPKQEEITRSKISVP